jgi:hypothetical protein
MGTKISRDKLKGIVKECLLEILAEGISSSSINESVSTRTKSPPTKRKTNTNNINQSSPKNQIHEVIHGITEDPIMKNIFQDTLETTYKQRILAEKNGHSGDGTTINGNPEEIFGEVSSKWEKLAFSTK